jgi:hypothetical protein
MKILFAAPENAWGGFLGLIRAEMYVEDLKRGSNAEACPPHRQRHLRPADWAKRLF